MKSFISKCLKTGRGDRLYPVGSFARGEDYSGDLDILILGKKINISCPHTRVSGGDVRETYIIHAAPEFQMDVFYLPKEQAASLPFMLLYLMGPKSENLRMRSAAKRMGLKLNQFGIYRGTKALPIKTVKELYVLLNLTPPTPVLDDVPYEDIKQFFDSHVIGTYKSFHCVDHCSVVVVILGPGDKIRMVGVRKRKKGQYYLVQPPHMDGYFKLYVERQDRMHAFKEHPSK